MTLLSANDRFEILDLCSRYNRCLDSGDEEGAMDCWAHSGISFESPKGKYTSWDQLKRQLSKELHGASGSSGGPSHRSVIFNVVIRDGESVDTAYVDSEYLLIDRDSLQIAETGSFVSDRVSRTSMGWKFVRRTQKPDLRARASKAPQVPSEARAH